MIPRIIHHVWLGIPMPEHLAHHVATWPHHHPGWQHRVWIGFDDLRNQTLYDRAEQVTPHVGQFRADLARYEILHRYGGVYVDCDFECRRPLDELIEGLECFAAWETDGRWINNAIMGAEPGLALFDELIERLPANVARHPGKRPNVMTGPQYLTPIWRDHDAHVFPASMFYPYRWDQLDRADSEFPDAYAVHHWENARRRAAS